MSSADCSATRSTARRLLDLCIDFGVGTALGFGAGLGVLWLAIEQVGA